MKKLLAIAGATLALAATAHADPLPTDVMNNIRRLCAAEWQNDYDMRLFCENKQVEAARKLQDRGSVSETQPSVENTEKALKAMMMFAAGVKACNLSTAETDKILRKTKEMLGSLGYTMDTIMNVDRNIFAKVNAETPVMGEAVHGDKEAIESVCPAVRKYIADLK
jgi:hypothetical protein